MNSCRNCGASIAGDRRFCTTCGQPLGVERPAEPPGGKSHRLPIVLAGLMVLVVVGGAAWLVVRAGGNRIAGSGSTIAATSARTTARPSVASTSSPPSDVPTSAPARSTTGPTRPEAASEAKSVDALLGESSGSRAVITPELSALSTGCDTVDPATVVGDLQTAIRDRTDIVRQLSAQPMAALPAGPALRRALTRAMTTSVQADRDYLRWAQLLASTGCTSTDNSGLVDGNAISTGQATPAKRTFVSMWNPVARKYGLPHRADGDI